MHLVGGISLYFILNSSCCSILKSYSIGIMLVTLHFPWAASLFSRLNWNI